MRRISVFVSGLGALFFLLTACTVIPIVPPAVEPPVETATPAADALAETPTATIRAEIPGASAAAQPLLCSQCGGGYYLLQNGEVIQLDLPENLIGLYYDYAPATNAILYASAFPDHGAGPATLSVSDLQRLDVSTQESTTLIAGEVVVRAQWAPDGQHVVYVGATDETYELRWRTPNGEETVLATDVSPFFGISSSGEQVAFTRESPYADAEPGVFVVDVNTQEERQLSDLDKAGTGSLDDKPIWSPDDEHFMVRFVRDEDLNGLYRFAVDGSAAVELAYDPALAEEDWYEQPPVNAIWHAPTQFIGTTFVYTETSPLGGDPLVVLYELDEELDTIVAGTTVAGGMLIGWDMPGASVWIYDEAGIQSVPLPNAQP